jgi:DNA polymerase-3 subunit epsilon
MENAEWIIFDTLVAGRGSPVHLVELCAQRMRGWQPWGPPFRRLLRPVADFPADFAGPHGYTRDSLERDGEEAPGVFTAFAEYVGWRSLVSYNLAHDLNEVLRQEWSRHGIAPIGQAGFCALRLAYRLLDPVPTGSCSLQTLRSYYRLPEHGGSTAWDDLQTVLDLLGSILAPVAAKRGLDTWDTVAAYAKEEWYPSRLTFGKHKGRSILDAPQNPELMSWLQWLAESANEQSASMGRWYLREIQRQQEKAEEAVFIAPASLPAEEAGDGSHGIVIYTHPDLQRLRGLVTASRARLADLEAAYTAEKNNVTAVQARLFQHLKKHHRERERLRLIISYRRTYLETLLREGEEEAARLRGEYQEADARTEKDYRETEAAMQAKHKLSGEEEEEVKSLWRKLVKVFHPDRYADDPEMQATYTKLTGVINTAKDSGDLQTLRLIADDPAAYILRQGWGALDLSDTDEVNQLEKLLNSLEAEILTVIEALNSLRASPAFELYQMAEKEPSFFERVVEQRAAKLEEEVSQLEAEAAKLREEIIELAGEDAPSLS